MVCDCNRIIILTTEESLPLKEIKVNYISGDSPIHTHTSMDPAAFIVLFS